MKQNIQRISHVSFIVHPENHDEAVAHFNELFGINMEGPLVLPGFNKIHIDWDSGLEVFSPVDADGDTIFNQHLRERGEGFYSLVFGVEEMGEAMERARGLGYDSALSVDGLDVNEEWATKFRKIHEEVLDKPTYGANFTLGQIEPS